MKKTLLSLLLVSLSLTMFLGCAEDKTDTPPPVTPVIIGNVNTLVGNYTADVFATLAAGTVFTNDCNQYKSIVVGATCDNTKNVSLATQARITIVEGFPVLETKVQIWGGNFDEMANIPGMEQAVKPNSYNYTRYNKLVLSPDDELISTSVNSRNFDGLSAFTTPIGTITLLSDKSGRLEVLFNGIVNMGELQIPTSTTVILRKVSDVPSALNPNTLVTNQGYMDGFAGTEVIAPLP